MIRSRTFVAAFVVGLILAAAGCGENNPAKPSGGVPVISSFVATPASGKAPLTVEFAIKTSDATSCEILIGGIGDVSCNGVKSWTVSQTTTFTLFAYGVGGVTARQSVVVTITP